MLSSEFSACLSRGTEKLKQITEPIEVVIVINSVDLKNQISWCCLTVETKALKRLMAISVTHLKLIVHLHPEQLAGRK